MRHHLHYHRRGPLPGLLLVLWLAGALAACGVTRTGTDQGTVANSAAATSAAKSTTPTAAGQSTPAKQANATQGTLTGEVVAAPTCPVERAEDPCPPKPVPGRQVVIVAASGSVAATVTTDAQGHFQLALAPGSYTLAVPGELGTPGGRQIAPAHATVVAGQTAHVTIVLDTGIR